MEHLVVKPLGYQPALDGIRGIAIASVVSLHTFGWPLKGGLGVDVFFVLSGFLITTLLLEEQARDRRIRLLAFYRRRAWRLFPALFAMLLVYILVIGARGELGDSAIALLGAFSYSSNFLMAFNEDAIPQALGHLWSLAQEEQFYLLWPFLLIAMLRRRPAALAKVVVVLLAIVVVERFVLAMQNTDFDRVYFGLDTHADPILVGCLFGICRFRSREAVPDRLVQLASMLSLVLVIAAIVFADPIWKLLYGTPLFTLFAAATGVVIVSAVSRQCLVTRALSILPLVVLGRISYSLYLWHMPTLAAFGVGTGAFTVRSFAALAVSLAAAVASYQLVEARFLSRRRSPRMVSPQAPAPAVA